MAEIIGKAQAAWNAFCNRQISLRAFYEDHFTKWDKDDRDEFYFLLLGITSRYTGDNYSYYKESELASSLLHEFYNANGMYSEYTFLPELNQEPKRQMHVDRGVEEMTNIFAELQNCGLVSKNNVVGDWLYAFGLSEESGAKVVWIAKNKNTRQPSKKSLLDLLVTLGVQEKDIRRNINALFEVEGARMFYSSNYSNYRDFAKDIRSEYHMDIERIANMGQ